MELLMSFSIQRETSDGTLSTLDLTIEYIDKTDVKAFVNDVEIELTGGVTPYTWEWITSAQIKITPNVPNGLVAMVKRSTPMDAMYHVYDAGAVFKDETVDENFKQVLFLSQEAKEGSGVSDIYSNVNMHGYVIGNHGAALLDSDLVTFGQYRNDALGSGFNRVAAESARDMAVASKDTAVTSATAAGNSAGAASTSATNAANSASASDAARVLAQDAASTAVAAYDSFDDRYLGPKNSDPALDNDGNALLEGALYWNTVAKEMRVYDGTAWSVAYLPVGAYVTETEFTAGLANKVSTTDLANTTDQAKGAALVGYAGRTLREKLLDAISVKDFGAVGDGVADDTVAIQSAIDSLPATGGEVYFPRGIYYVTTADLNNACVWVNKDNVTLAGDGAGSIIKTTVNEHVPVHVSPERNLSVVNISGVSVKNFTMTGLCVSGTGVYQNFGLAYGRGVLLRKVRNAVIRDNFVFNMSMIGICTEHGEGNFLIAGNIVGGCKYTAINFNGRAYQSIISNNICYGSDASPDAIAIQATGHCIVSNNTVYGSPGNFANCGGIMWGEGPYNGVGSISGNLVKHCRYGITAVYHGTCNVTGNTIVNCMTTGGIVLVGGTGGGYSVESDDNMVTNNLLINNYPTQIETSAPRTLISGNKLLVKQSPVNASAPTEPDTIIGIIPEYSIHLISEGNSVLGNVISGSQRGIVIRKGKSQAQISGNDVRNLQAPGLVAYESSRTAGVIVALTPLIDRKSGGGGVYKNLTIDSTKPSQGFWAVGDQWDRFPSLVGQSLGEVVIVTTDTVTTAPAMGGAATISVAVAPSAASGNLLGVELDNGSYHWTSAIGVSGLVVTLASAIPAGRSVLAGAAVNGQQWRQLATLA